jgi:tetratricopeptide (TPR) repeat protein
MSKQNRQEVTVFFNKRNWTNIKRVIESFLNEKEQNDKSEWNTVVKKIEISIQNQNSEHLSIGIPFDVERLDKIKSIIKAICQRKGGNWLKWGDDIASSIDKTIENPEVVRAKEDAWNLWEEAAWRMEEENAGKEMYNDAASFLMMAIERYPQPFQEAHSLLATAALRLGKADLAQEHADLALKYNSSDFSAQSVKVYLAASQLQLFKMSGIAGMDGSLTDLIIGAFAWFKTSKSQDRFRKEVEEWLSIFVSQTNSSRYKVDDFLYHAQEIMELADRIMQKPVLQSIAMMMYDAIISVNLDKLSFESRQVLEQARRIQVLAQGRTRL